MQSSRPWTVRCARRRYEYNTVVVEAENLDEALAKAVDAADADIDGWDLGKEVPVTFCDAAAPGAHDAPEAGECVEIPPEFGDRK